MVSVKNRVIKLVIAIIVAINLGLLEAAWTTPVAPGAVKAGLGCFAIGVILTVVSYPYIWWVPGLSMVEEFVQVFVGSEGNWMPNSDWIFHHWSAGYFGINLYPVISFPLFSFVIEACYKLWRKNENINKCC
ncbi:MAG: hypothetical protein N3G21_12160 [Candidatus Hydrogenedentes bacterium]|nr:hypothetical protein [Candidatus Hydrogenedentota bacterium]